MDATPFIQPKLAINSPNDVYEQEADAISDKVMRMEQSFIHANPLFISGIQRKCDHCEEEEKKAQRKEMNGEEAGVDSFFESYVGSLNGIGQALSNEVRNFYEPRFGHDFSNVKIHTDTIAAKSAQSINALAYTSKNNIVFNEGQYSPSTSNGKRLLGHELTHVVQQGSGDAYKHSGDFVRNINKPSAVIHRVAQEPTLAEAKKTGTKLNTKSLTKMDVNTLAGMSDAERKQWYIDKLGPYENQLRESANKNLVPVQLLAVVILNELADIDWKDIVQSGLSVDKGSLGMSQIQIETAIKDNLFDDITDEEGKAAYDSMVVHPQYSGMGKLFARLMQTSDKEKRMAVNRRLQIPQYSIEAAAREIRHLLNQMMANTGADWQSRFGFTHKGIVAPNDAQSIYNDIAGTTQLQKETNLSKLITGAYNSPKIIMAANSAENDFPNANIHGDNSKMIAGDLYNFKLFRP
ncbi:MAG: DUF4157 domain-containing protein [Ferruginibacter sp.]